MTGAGGIHGWDWRWGWGGGTTRGECGGEVVRGSRDVVLGKGEEGGYMDVMREIESLLTFRKGS